MPSPNRFFDDMTRFFGDAAGAAQGMRREVETLVKAQIERFLRDMDVATREELAVVRDQLDEVRRQNERLRDRVAILEGSPGESPAAGGAKRGRSGTRAGVGSSGDMPSAPGDAPAGNTL